MSNIASVNALAPGQVNPYGDPNMDSMMLTPGFNGSIWNGYPGFGMDMGMGLGMGYGMGYGFGMGYGMGYNFENIKRQQANRTELIIDQNKYNRNVDLKVNAPMEAIKSSATVLKDKIVQNEQDQILDAYKNYLDAVRAAYGEGTHEEISARAKTLYAQMNGGKSLVQDIREHAHGSTTQGILHALSLGCYDKYSAEDNISEINNAPVSETEKSKQNGGRLLGSALLGGIVGGIATVLKGIKAGGIAGLAVAAFATAMTMITGKIST